LLIFATLLNQAPIKIMNKIYKTFLTVIFALSINFSFGQSSVLRPQIAEIAKSAKGIVGVSVWGLEDRDTVSYNGNARLVMESVIKFPIAMAVLHLVDSGVLKLDQTIRIKKEDLPKTYSPLRDKYPNGGVDVSIDDLLGYMVSQSDNDACDILLKKLGGPDQVNYYLRMIKIKGINIDASEEDMAKTPEAQYTDWCRPKAMVHLLDTLFTGSVLKPASRDYLNKLMIASTTGPDRIKGLLPAGTIVAHKTGTSGVNDAGLALGTNDVGVITLPNKKHVAIAVFITNSTADEATRDLVIAKIAKAVYDNQLLKKYK
jgi:beta-lactamase class A